VGLEFEPFERKERGSENLTRRGKEFGVGTV